MAILPSAQSIDSTCTSVRSPSRETPTGWVREVALARQALHPYVTVVTLSFSCQEVELVDQGFSVASGVREGCQVVVVRGELDESTAPLLESAIADCCTGWPVIVDLCGVEFMSSAGLHALLRERSVRLSIVAPPGNVARLFEIVHANRRCPLFSDLDSAISTATPLAIASPEAG
jgi:anti-anti-sigma factor